MKNPVVVIFGVLVAFSLFPVVSSARENQDVRAPRAKRSVQAHLRTPESIGITNRVCDDRR